MTAYRSSNDYRQDTLRYDGGTNVTVAVTTIAAVATLPAVSIAVDQTVSASTIATTATTPAVTVKIGVTVNVTTVSTSGLIPDPTISVGTGVTVTLAVVTGTATIPEETVSEGTGQTVSLSTVAATTSIPDLSLARRLVMVTDAPVALLDVLPYHVITPQRRWKSRFAATGRRGLNLFILTDNTITTRQPLDPSTISRQILAGHEPPTDLTTEEDTLLVNAGYSFEVA